MSKLRLTDGHPSRLTRAHLLYRGRSSTAYLRRETPAGRKYITTSGAQKNAFIGSEFRNCVHRSKNDRADFNNQEESFDSSRRACYGHACKDQDQQNDYPRINNEENIDTSIGQEKDDCCHEQGHYEPC